MTGSGPDNVTLPAVLLGTWLPFISFVTIVLFTRARRALSAAISVGSVTVSLFSAVVLLGCHWSMEKPLQLACEWITVKGVSIPFGFLIDPTSLLMFAIVAGISFLVQVYSLGYMAGDEGFPRYFAFMSLFAWAMLNLALAATILQLYIFWELVGLSSYLLIGFWYEKFSATQAGKKAFVMTRAGDVAFFLGLMVILLHLGNFSILGMNGPEAAKNMSPTMLALAAFLIFGGIVGKSAQFPLLTWLPDAMEGPTPVSALLHSATMVAAGVYLFARLFPFFSLSPVAMDVFLAVGTISMLMASTMAMVDRDIKKVWAFSTISQLGFMIMALASGGREGHFGGFYHLATHAGFKALLFLCSGVFIHRCATNDMFELSAKGCRRLKIPTAAIVVAAAALSGIPPLAGFYSKEVILTSLAGLENPLWLVAGMVGVFLTAYYAFRVVFILIAPGRVVGEVEAIPSGTASHHDAHGNGKGYAAMTAPLVVLAAITLVLGFFEKAIREFLLGPDPVSSGSEMGMLSALPVSAMVLVLAGVGLAWMEFGRSNARLIGFVERFPSIHRLFAERWYLDRLYAFVMDRLVDRGISSLFLQSDNKVIDGAIDGLCRGAVEGGRAAAFLQQGTIQYRLIAAFAVTAFFALYYFF